MTQIVLIRPGATDYDRDGRIQGNLDVPLNEEGTAEVAKVIEELRGQKLDVLYTSGSQPALETAEVISAVLDTKLKKLEGMQNVDLGLWQGKSVEEIRLKQPKVYRLWQEMPQNVCPPEGEMLSDAEERVRQVMCKLIKRHKDGRIGIVVPEPLASLVRHCVNHGDLGDLWKATEDHGQWEIFEAAPGAVSPAI
jgi:broad specificity phosphatase PhoE